MIRLGILLALLPSAVLADSIVATRIIRAQSIVTEDAISFSMANFEGAIVNPSEVLGLEARTTIYPGRPIRPDDVGPPALIDRNEIVTLIYASNGLSILTEGRSLSRAAAGERARVMNLSSRKSVSGIVRPDGSVMVAN